ncbi:amidase [Lichenibacterium ramalinae]|uniref:Amidase n=1 Tax=Lichenibacterium ramalinae TaxID=2316527 RepID=A0A4V1RI16_9HYPH|nr:amidase [Lichenibacterium ramalinae]RYB01977.1 amidase [Lichenibacterium ramalinae]
MTEPADLSAVDLLAGFASGALSPSECWDSVERRIAAWEPTVAALYAYDPEGARREAAAATERWARGAPKGRLDGLPVSVKELIATRGVPVPRGCAATKLVPAAADAPPAARLREDGAVIFAKTTCPDHGMLTSGLSSFHPLTRNPWDPALNPGGSSSGAGAAAAAGYGPLHVGTDIGGSIRLPAALTGTVGFKPSNGRIPIDPYYLGRCAGPMTRGVADAALAMATLARPDGRDHTALPPEALAWDALDMDVGGLRIGLMRDAGCGLAVDAETDAAVVAAARVFAAAGARIEPVGPVLTRAMLDGLDVFWRARAWGEIGPLPATERDRILPYILAWAEGGARVSGVEALAGLDATYAMRRACGRLFDGVDVVLSPTIPVPSYPAEWASPLDDPARPFEHIAFTVPWNMSEQPALSLPCGSSAAGLPLGLQIVGPRFADLAVLRLGAFYEAARGPMPPWPSP